MRLLTETKQVKLGESEFTIGVIDRRRFHPIKTRFLMPTKFLTKITQEELKTLSPAQIGQKAIEGLTRDEIIKNEELAFAAQWDMVKYGVKTHSIKDSDNKEIPLVKDDGGCVADQTIEFYDLNGLLAGLANEIFVFNTMSETEKKN